MCKACLTKDYDLRKILIENGMRNINKLINIFKKLNLLEITKLKKNNYCQI